MAIRGTYQFEVKDSGNIVDNSENVERARKLFCDGTIISNCWGPGDPGDFDYGGWHCLCHLAAAAGVFKYREGYLLVVITHAGTVDKYLPTVTYRESNGAVQTIDINSDKAKQLLSQGQFLGYIEGSSEGHISARNVQDTADSFNNWLRQKFDQAVDSKEDGGTVWEHWCTTRDLRKSHPIGDSVLISYVSLVSVLGGTFVATVARGRRTYEHPVQLCAMIKSGFVDKKNALWDAMPHAIPLEAQRLFYEAQPESSLKAVESLRWGEPGEKFYYMFSRRIGSWSKKSDVENDLRRFGL